jgi:hypothetical protein
VKVLSNYRESPMKVSCVSSGLFNSAFILRKNWTWTMICSKPSSYTLYDSMLCYAVTPQPLSDPRSIPVTLPNHLSHSLTPAPPHPSQVTAYHEEFSSDTLPLDGDFDGETVFVGRALRHGCTNDVRYRTHVPVSSMCFSLCVHCALYL